MTQLSESQTRSVGAIGDSGVILSEQSEAKDLERRIVMFESDTRSVAAIGDSAGNDALADGGH